MFDPISLLIAGAICSIAAYTIVYYAYLTWRIIADISPEILAEVEDVCGRDIKNAVIDAAMRVARKGKLSVELVDLLDSINRIKSARINVLQSDDLSPHTKEKISQQLKEALSQKELESK